MPYTRYGKYEYILADRPDIMTLIPPEKLQALRAQMEQWLGPEDELGQQVFLILTGPIYGEWGGSAIEEERARLKSGGWSDHMYAHLQRGLAALEEDPYAGMALHHVQTLTHTPVEGKRTSGVLVKLDELRDVVRNDYSTVIEAGAREALNDLRAFMPQMDLRAAQEEKKKQAAREAEAYRARSAAFKAAVVQELGHMPTCTGITHLRPQDAEKLDNLMGMLQDVNITGDDLRMACLRVLQEVAKDATLYSRGRADALIEIRGLRD